MAFLVLLEQLPVRLGLLLQREGVGAAVKAGSSAVDGFRNAPSTAKWTCFCGRHSVLCTICRTERGGGCGVAGCGRVRNSMKSGRSSGLPGVVIS